MNYKYCCMFYTILDCELIKLKTLSFNTYRCVKIIQVYFYVLLMSSFSKSFTKPYKTPVNCNKTSSNIHFVIGIFTYLTIIYSVAVSQFKTAGQIY